MPAAAARRRIKRVLEGFGPVVFDRPEQRAVFGVAVAGGLEVLVDQRVGPWMQRQIAGLLALAFDLEMRDTAERVLEILNLELAEPFAP